MQQMQDASGKTPLVQSWLKTVWWFAGSYKSQNGNCTYLSAGNQSSNWPWKSLISTDTNIIICTREQSATAAWCLCTVLPHSSLIPTKCWGLLLTACILHLHGCGSDWMPLQAQQEQIVLCFLSPLAAKYDHNISKVAMTLINAGQEQAQGITKHVLVRPTEHMESKARGCSLSSLRNTAMLQPQEALYQLGIDLGWAFKSKLRHGALAPFLSVVGAAGTAFLSSDISTQTCITFCDDCDAWLHKSICSFDLIFHLKSHP